MFFFFLGGGGAGMKNHIFETVDWRRFFNMTPGRDYEIDIHQRPIHCFPPKKS